MKVKGLRWIILSLIMLVSIINYLDRGTFNYMWVANTKSEYPADRVLFDAAAGSCTLTAEDGTQITVPADRVTAGDDGTYVYTAVGGIAAELGILDPSMSEADFSARSKQMLANITIFFMIAYGLSQLFSGKLYDRIGTRRGFAFSALLWGAADALTALASGIKSLTCFRFLLGLGEAGPWPGTTKSNAEWFPSKERAMAQGLFNASTSVGSILAPIVISFLYLAFGWKATFAIVGTLAVIWIIPWLWINKKGPKDHPWITDKEREYILSGQPEGHATDPGRCKSWGELLREKKNYALIVGRFFIDPVWWIFVTFIPIYLIEVFNLDIREVAMSAWVPYVGAAIGAFAGGWFSGLLQKRGHSLNFARKCSMIVGVTDAMRGAGMPDGPTVLGSIDDGVPAIIEDGVAKLPDRSAFAGSVCTTDRVVRSYVTKTGATLPEAVQIMTLTPARLMKIDDRKGSIAPGKDADIVLFDDGINVSLTMIGGRVVYGK